MMCGQSEKKIEIGKSVGNFKLDTLHTDSFSLKQHKGKIVVLMFWATWCRCCKIELVELRDFARQPGWKDVVVALVCIDPENLSQAQNLIKKLHITFPILLDHEARLYRQFQLLALPTTLVIDPRQRLRFLRVGFDSAIMERLETLVTDLNKSGNLEG